MARADDLLPGVEPLLKVAVCLDVVEGEYLVDGGPQCTEAHAGVQEGRGTQAAAGGSSKRQQPHRPP
ncbi:MAG TPA: hypothetical protein VHZ03_47610 [Trebonia sp.]|jgi:hypothetical protein|nr:hypothetical protein [Trebonia sp.]